MLPFNTLNSCGNSSMLVRRSQRPHGVIRGSSATLKTGPRIGLKGRSSARRISPSLDIKQNLYITKGFPFFPARSCRKQSGLWT